MAYADDLTPIFAPLDEAGRFTLALPGEHTYTLHFTTPQRYTAGLAFPSSGASERLQSRLVLPFTARSGLGPSSRDPAAPRSGLGPSSRGLIASTDALDGEWRVALGELTLDGALALPEHNPNAGLDSDGDGVVNLEDEDADGDGVDDLLEDERVAPPGAGAPFFVYRVAPQPGSDQAPRGARPRIWFSAPVSVADLIGGAVQLRDADGALVEARLHLRRGGHLVTLVPTAPLEYGGAYTLHVSPDLTDTRARPLRLEGIYPFHVEPMIPEVEEGAAALKVRRAEPRHGQLEVSVDTRVWLVFNRLLDEATLAERFQLLDPAGAPVAGELTLPLPRLPLVAIFTPEAPLSPLSRYTISVAAGVRDQGDLSLESPLELSFTTEQPGEGQVIDPMGPEAPCEPAPEVCDGEDDDCDGLVDEDVFELGAPCESALPGLCAEGAWICAGVEGLQCQPQVTPDATPERCDAVDEDCDGAMDEGLSEACYSGPEGTLGVGVCRAGASTCDGGEWGLCADEVTPSEELCDALDNDCDGETDEPFAERLGLSCSRGAGACRGQGTMVCSATGRSVTCDAVTHEPTDEACNGLDDDCDAATDEALARGCYDGAEGTAGVGICAAGVAHCEDAAWGACVGQILPEVEICDGLDDDCDGEIDEVTPRQCGSNIGQCRAGARACVGGAWGACEGAIDPTPEICDGVDNDCDGSVDEQAGCDDD